MLEERVIKLLNFSEPIEELLIAMSKSADNQIRGLVEKMGTFEISQVEGAGDSKRSFIQFERYSKDKTGCESFRIYTNHTKICIEYSQTKNGAIQHSAQVRFDNAGGKGMFLSTESDALLFNLDKEKDVIRDIRTTEYDRNLDKIELMQFSKETKILLKALLDSGNPVIEQLQFYSEEQISKESKSNELVLVRYVSDAELETIIINDKHGLMIELQDTGLDNEYRETIFVKPDLTYSTEKQEKGKDCEYAVGSLRDYVALDELIKVGNDGEGK